MGHASFPDRKLRKGSRFAPRQRWLAAACALLLLLCLPGCAIFGDYILSTKTEITRTPVQYGIAYTEVWFPTSDGARLNGWLVPGTPGHPPILFFHGNAGNLSDNMDYIRLLHSKGFTIFIFDYRGFGRSTGKALGEDDLYRDARGALNYLEKTGWHHQETIFYGQSLGGAVALQMALETPPAALVLESTFTSMADVAKHLAPAPYYLMFWWCVDLGFDNVGKIKQNKVPLLLLHGDKDPVAPVRMAHALYARALQPKTLQILPDGGHCDAFERKTDSYLETWSRFLSTIPSPTPTGRAAAQ